MSIEDEAGGGRLEPPPFVASGEVSQQTRPAKRRAVAYLRVSTDAQVEGEGLGVQRDTIHRWARGEGIVIVKTCADEGESGTIADRYALLEAVHTIKEGAADGIIVWRLDRLARDVILQEQLLREVWTAGGRVWSTSQAETTYLFEDPDDPSRRLIRVVLGAVSEYERAMIVLRMKAGRARKHARGGFAYGSPPYGWAAVDGELVPIPSEQAVIEFARRCRGSLRHVVKRLNEEGYRTRRGFEWRPESVKRILRKR